MKFFFVAFTLSRPVKGVDRRFAAEASERRRAGGANRRRGGDLPKVPGRPRSRSARSGSSSTACWAARWRDRPGPKSALPVSPPVRSAKIKAGGHHPGPLTQPVVLPPHLRASGLCPHPGGRIGQMAHIQPEISGSRGRRAPARRVRSSATAMSTSPLTPSTTSSTGLPTMPRLRSGWLPRVRG